VASPLEPGRRWIRRNTVIELREQQGTLHVLKTYHGTYSAEDELRAYRALAPVAAGVPDIGLPSNVTLEPGTAQLQREFIPGRTLRDLMLSSPDRARQQFLPTVTALLVASRRSGVTFDSDSSNFIVRGRTLFVIDPLMPPLKLKHPTAAIFLFGLVKIALASATRPWRLPGIARTFHDALGAYAAQTSTPPRELYGDLANYISEVIGWNRHDATVAEGRVYRFARRYGVIPVYAAIRMTARLLAR
jgi:hypothetical protein